MDFSAFHYHPVSSPSGRRSTSKLATGFPGCRTSTSALASTGTATRSRSSSPHPRSGAGLRRGLRGARPVQRVPEHELDHHNLHEILPFEPTSERLAQFLAGWFLHNLQPAIPGRLVAVLVRETQGSWARFDVEGQ